MNFCPSVGNIKLMGNLDNIKIYKHFVPYFRSQTENYTIFVAFQNKKTGNSLDKSVLKKLRSLTNKIPAPG